MAQQNLIHLAPGFSMPASDYANQANAILGIRKAGKSYTALKAAEELLENDIPIIAYDPVGIWKNLKVGVGKHKGYPIVVAGGEGSDIILTPQNAVSIVRAAMKENVSLVIDLYSPELINKSTWIKVVQETVDLLMYENKAYGLRHIFLEEAAEFIPQRLQPQHARVYASLERVARMGRNAGLGLTLINQRAEEVNKAILEICELSFLHQQVGKNSMVSIQKWLEIRQIKNVKEIVGSLPGLKRGECWALGTAEAKKIHVSRRNTFHPDPNATSGSQESKSMARDVSSFVSKMNEQLKAEKESKKPAPKVSPAESGSGIHKAVQSSRDREVIAELNKKIKAQEIHISKLNQAIQVYEKRNNAFSDKLRIVAENLTDSHGIKVDGMTASIGTTIALGTEKLKNSLPGNFEGKAISNFRSPKESTGNLSAGERAILTALAQYENGVTRPQLTLLTGYARSTRDKYLQYLQQKGFARANNDRMFATESGIDELGDFEALPTGERLQEYWLNKLPEGESKILKVLIDHYPDRVNRENISESTGLARSTRDKYLQYLQAKELVISSKEGVVAAENLFTE